jgi:hypothetical protein
MTVHGAESMGEPDRRRARDVALRRTRAIVAGVAAAAVGLSGGVAVVAAQAFKGRPRPTRTTATTAHAARTTGHRVHVPGPQSVPAIAGQPAPLQPPAQPPAPADPQPSAPAPQVSGGS